MQTMSFLRCCIKLKEVQLLKRISRRQRSAALRLTIFERKNASCATGSDASLSSMIQLDVLMRLLHVTGTAVNPLKVSFAPLGLSSTRVPSLEWYPLPFTVCCLTAPPHRSNDLSHTAPPACVYSNKTGNWQPVVRYFKALPRNWGVELLQHYILQTLVYNYAHLE